VKHWPLLLGAGLACLPGTALAETISGRVSAIVDGDTLTLVDAQHRQHQIRLAAIDAPERLQAFGEQSRSHLAALAFNQPASASCHRRDSQGRAICRVTVAQRDLGLEQIRAGMAWWYWQDSQILPISARQDYEHAEFQAKIRRFGLWNSKNPVPPWEWRP